jgi:protein O-GlcNAc transferase
MFNWFKKTAVAAKVAPESDVAATQGVDSINQSAISESEVLKNQGNAYLNNGRLEDAAECYRRAIERNPRYAEAYSNLGYVFEAQGNLDEAVALYRKAIGFNPNLLAAHQNLGFALLNLGQNDAAEEILHRVIALAPEHAAALQSLGAIAAQRGDFLQAETLLRHALKLQPDYVEAHNNLGAILHLMGRQGEAKASYRRALEIKPDYAEAHNNLGITLLALGQIGEAEVSFRKALQIKPDYAEAHSGLGIAMKELGQLDAAVASCRRALEIRTDYAEGYINLGNALKDLGQFDDAVSNYRQALEIKPSLVEAYSNILYLHAFTRNISPELERSFAAKWENIVLSESERVAARDKSDSFIHSSRVGRKLKIGVVSAEIGQHAVAEFLEPFLEQLDRSRFHITLFPTTTKQDSRATRLRELADEFKPLVGIPDNKAADLIRADRIDILIDTTAYMRGCRLGIFAHRAAPVQCHYIGYHGSTGLTEMDWFIADGELLPHGYETHFREGIWRLPCLWISYRGDTSLPESRWMPSLDGTVWLGSFNNLTKVREETLALWAKVMNAIPEARLFLKDRKSVGHSVQERIRIELARHDISGERVEFAGHVSDWPAHMALYDKLDIALDAIPLNSGTTAFDALWMGVPLIALEGNWMGGRMSSTILKALGKPEWVAQNEDEYVAIVTALARDVVGRKSLRTAQRTLMAGSPLCDAKGLTMALGDAFEKMFDRMDGKM